MISIYQEIVSFDGVNFHDHLERMDIKHIFEPILTSTYFSDNTDQIKICQYIVYTHSVESTKLAINGDRRKSLSSVFKSLGLKESFYADVVLLKREEVLKSAIAWLKKQGDRQFEYLLTLQNAYIQQQSASLQDIRKGTSIEIDYDQKMRCIQHMETLKKMIKEAESELQQNDPRLKEAYEEIKQASKSRNIIGVEQFAH